MNFGSLVFLKKNFDFIFAQVHMVTIMKEQTLSFWDGDECRLLTTEYKTPYCLDACFLLCLHIMTWSAVLVFGVKTLETETEMIAFFD